MSSVGTPKHYWGRFARTLLFLEGNFELTFITSYFCLGRSHLKLNILSGDRWERSGGDLEKMAILNVEIRVYLNDFDRCLRSREGDLN